MMRVSTCTACLSLAAMLAMALPAQASVTYDYVGNPFTSDIVAGPGYNETLPPDGEFLTASITFDAITTDNFTGTVTVDDEILQPPQGTPVSDWHVGDILSDGALLASFTFVNGEIVSWNVIAAYPFGPSPYAMTFHDASGTGDSTGFDYETKSNQDDPGRWIEAVAAVPTPGSLLIFLSGLAGLFGVTRFRRRQRPIGSLAG